MKGYVPVEIPVKRYVKAFIERNHSSPIMFDRRNKSAIIEKIFDYLERDQAIEIIPKHLWEYKYTIKVYLTNDQFHRRGAWLNSSNIRNFNSFAETLIKERFRLLMDEAWKVSPGFDCHLPSILRALNLTSEDWDYEAIKKDYYRYRLRNDMPILQKTRGLSGKISALHLPFM